MPRFFTSTAFLLTCGVSMCVLVTGCGDAPDQVYQDTTMTSSQPAQATETSLVLAEMPEGEIVTPTEVKESGEQAVSVILGGRIDAGDADPFQPGELAFMISQLPDEGHGEGDPDHADNCPFCKRKLENAPRAIVQFKGSDGNVLQGDSRQTLALEKGDVVYVTGLAQYNAAVNTVMVNATGVFRKSGQ